MYRSQADRKNETLIRKLTYENSIERDLWSIPSDILTEHINIADYIQKYPLSIQAIAKTNELAQNDNLISKDLLTIDLQQEEIDKRLEILTKELQILGSQI